jgi:ribonucleoside-diphosphate reductase alpha chain
MGAPSLSHNALRVLEARYLRRDSSGQIAETPEEMFRRVARHLAAAETAFGTAAPQWEEPFFEAMSSLDLLPNSPCLMNAGTPLGMLSACFVLPVEDCMEGIFDALKLMARIQQAGGGVGFSFSRLRPQGDQVSSTGGAASGPVSFMRIFDCATENIKQGGRRRGANMGVLSIEHPDIELFIDAKRDAVSFRNFNLSVGVSDAFMEAVISGRPWTLRNPRTGQAVRDVPAPELWARIAAAACQTGDPGLLFLDAINRSQPTPALGPIEATNPCGEVPLLPYESCNLASINLTHMVRRFGDSWSIDWAKLAYTARLGVRLLDDMIEASRWPAPQIEQATRASRKIGLGVMGFAELLLLLGIPYASEQAVSLAEEIMHAIQEEALAASQDLARERGVFPLWTQSIYARREQPLRNATRTAIAPTGTLSILAGTSAGIEPLFALAYTRQVLEGHALVELNPVFVRYAQQQGFYTPELARHLAAHGSLSGLEGVPAAARAIFQTALEIAPEHHLRVQAAFQRFTDSSVSKTINLPTTATPDEIAHIYRRAWELGLKGVTVFRYGSKPSQVLTLGTDEAPHEREHFARCDPHGCKL